MAMPRARRNLLCAAIAAAVTTAGAIAVIAHADGDGTRKITGTADAAPGLGWTVEASTVHGNESARFRDPVYGSEYDWGMPGFLDFGDTLVTLVGVPGGMDLEDAVLVGVDADSGQVRWRSPADGVGGCADAAVDATLVCFTPGWSGDPTLVGYDLVTGEITRVPTEWGTFAIAAAGNRLYVAEGSVEDDDVRVRAGTLADPDTYFTRAFDMGTGWDDGALPDALDVTHGQGLVVLGTDIAGFDLGTGDPTWTARVDGCSRVQPTLGALVVRVHVECEGNLVTGSDLIDRTGAVIAATDSAAAQSLAFDDPTDDTVPALLADGAYDRVTGIPAWSSPIWCRCRGNRTNTTPTPDWVRRVPYSATSRCCPIGPHTPRPASTCAPGPCCGRSTPNGPARCWAAAETSSCSPITPDCGRWTPGRESLCGISRSARSTTIPMRSVAGAPSVPTPETGTPTSLLAR